MQLTTKKKKALLAEARGIMRALQQDIPQLKMRMGAWEIEVTEDDYAYWDEGAEPEAFDVTIPMRSCSESVQRFAQVQMGYIGGSVRFQGGWKDNPLEMVVCGLMGR